MMNFDREIPAVVRTWTTPRGTRRRIVRFRGQEMTLERMCAKLGIPSMTVRTRLNRGFDIVDALTLPLRPRVNATRLEWQGREYKIPELAQIAGLPPSTLYSRLKTMPLEQAMRAPVESAEERLRSENESLRQIIAQLRAKVKELQGR